MATFNDVLVLIPTGVFPNAMSMGTISVFVPKPNNPTQQYTAFEVATGEPTGIVAKYNNRFDDPTYYSA
jgi:hypothetical protein